MSQLNAAERRFLENATVIGAQRALFGKLSSVGVPIRKLGDVADTTSGGTPDRNNSTYYGGQTPWLKSGELTDGLVTEIEESLSEEGLANSNAKVIPKGTLLIALYGATVGKTGILGVSAATNQAVCAITPKTQEIKTPYLYWFLRYKREDFLQMSFGGAQPNISQRILRDTLVPLPPPSVQENISTFLSAVEKRMRGSNMELPELLPPLAEQRRVVARIEELASQIHEARTLRHQAAEEAEALVSSVRAKLFEEAPVEREETFDSLVEQIRGSAGLPLKEYQQSGRYPVIDQGQQFIGGYCDDESRLLRVNRPVVVWGDHTTNVKLVDFDFVAGADGTKVFQPKEFITAPFLFHVLQAVRYPELGYSRHYRVLKDIMVRVPPLPEQRRIVSELDALQAEVDALKRLQAETAAELAALLPSILDRAFKGEM